MSGRTSRDHRDSALRTAGTVLWALIPAATLGFGTGPVMIHAAIRKRSWLHGGAAALYIASVCVMLSFDPDLSTTNDRIFNICLVINLIVGTAHAFVIRSWVWDTLPPGSNRARRQSLREQQKAALAAHRNEWEARAAALAIVASDPRQAVDLKIGRADIGRRKFPDGGLVDINNVAAGTIARTTGLQEKTAKQIVRARDGVGGFSSVADLSVTLDLPPRALDHVADRLIFLPVAASRRHR